MSVFGPESTGKTTLAKRLAEHFDTVMVPEYARIHLERQQGAISADDLPRIARGQIASEDALARDANRVLICDTDPLATTIWSRELFGECESWIDEEATRRAYDLTLLTDVDVPWVADQVRYLPENRRTFFERCELALQTHQRTYVTLSGSWETRFTRACEAIEQALQTRFYQSDKTRRQEPGIGS
ncbi:MAG: AAA family ATPase [Polyangiaceae bacterium]